MKKIMLTAVLAVFTATGALAETVRLGTEGAYEPWNFVNDAGKLDGFEIELGNELCKRASLSCEWVKNDWDSIIPNLKSGNYDAIIAGMSITEERQKSLISQKSTIRQTRHHLLGWLVLVTPSPKVLLRRKQQPFMLGMWPVLVRHWLNLQPPKKPSLRCGMVRLIRCWPIAVI